MIYGIVQDQFILGMGGPVALNQVAIHEAMKMYGIEEFKVETFEKVLHLGRHFINKMNEASAAARER